MGKGFVSILSIMSIMSIRSILVQVLSFKF